MTIDEHLNKPPILEGLADWLLSESIAYSRYGDEDRSLFRRWASEVLAIQSALTQVGEEE